MSEGAEGMCAPEDGGKGCEMLSSKHGAADTLMTSQQLWPVLDLACQQLIMNHELRDVQSFLLNY